MLCFSFYTFQNEFQWVDLIAKMFTLNSKCITTITVWLRMNLKSWFAYYLI